MARPTVHAAFFSRNLIASPVTIVSAASSGISTLNSSSNAMTSSTVSRLSAPRSSMKFALSVTLSADAQVLDNDLLHAISDVTHRSSSLVDVPPLQADRDGNGGTRPSGR